VVRCAIGLPSLKLSAFGQFVGCAGIVFSSIYDAPVDEPAVGIVFCACGEHAGKRYYGSDEGERSQD